MRHFIWVFTVCQSTHLGISSIERVKEVAIMASALFEPRNEISDNVVCVTSKASGQPAHTRSLIRAFASSLNIL